MVTCFGLTPTPKVDGYALEKRLGCCQEPNTRCLGRPTDSCHRTTCTPRHGHRKGESSICGPRIHTNAYLEHHGGVHAERSADEVPRHATGETNLHLVAGAVPDQDAFHVDLWVNKPPRARQGFGETLKTNLSTARKKQQPAEQQSNLKLCEVDNGIAHIQNQRRLPPIGD